MKDLENVLGRALDATNASPSGSMPRPWRWQIWHAMGGADVLPDGDEPGVGRIARSALEILSARRAVRNVPTGLEDELLVPLYLSMRHLRTGLPDEQELFKAKDMLLSFAENAEPKIQFAAFSIESAVIQCVCDRVYEEGVAETIDDEQADQWDAGFWAAAALTGVLPWHQDAESTRQTRLSFWGNWAKDAMRAAEFAPRVKLGRRLGYRGPKI